MGRLVKLDVCIADLARGSFCIEVDLLKPHGLEHWWVLHQMWWH